MIASFCFMLLKTDGWKPIITFRENLLEMLKKLQMIFFIIGKDYPRMSKSFLSTKQVSYVKFVSLVE